MHYSDEAMSTYIDAYTAFLSQMEFIRNDVAIPKGHRAPMLLASIELTCAARPIEAALCIKNGDELTWDYGATVEKGQHKYKEGKKEMPREMTWHENFIEFRWMFH